MPESSIVVVAVNYNTRDELGVFLEGLGSWRERCVVFDNASSDGSVEMVRARFPDAMVVVSPVNIGYGAAANQVFRSHPAAIKAEVLILSNADIVLLPRAIEELVAELDRHPDVGVVGPLLRNQDGSLQRSCFPVPGSLRWLLDNDASCALLRHVPVVGRRLLRAWDHDEPRSVPWVKGAFMAIRRSAYEAVNGFDEAFFMYYEETDLCVRLRRSGWRTRFTPAASVIHLGGAATSKVRASMRMQQFISAMRFARWHYPVWWSVLLLGLWKLILVVRLSRDRIRLMAGDSDAGLVADIDAWRQALGFHFGDLDRWIG